MVALGSTEEMRVRCRYAFDPGYIDRSSWNEWREESREIAKMLQGLANTLDNRRHSDP